MTDNNGWDPARPGVPLNPERWRGAINDALTNWLSPIEDHETPKDALRRLIRLEIDAALDPAVSKSAADLVAEAKRAALEEAKAACIKTKDKFLQPAYAWGDPLASFAERFGCDQCINAIRALGEKE